MNNKKDNFRLEPTVHTSLIVLYSLVIIFGVIGNFAIVLAFLTNKVMLTTRNIFIANLAISDILLCSFTMPLTLVDLLTKVGLNDNGQTPNIKPI